MQHNRIKILHVIASNSIGGAENVLLTLSREIDREKFDLLLGIFVGKSEDGRTFWRAGMKANCKMEAIRIRSSYDSSQIRDLYKLIRRYRPQIIHTHGYKTNIIGFLMAKIFRIPIVTTFHGWLHTRKIKTKIFDRLNLLMLRHFDLIITVSDQIRLELECMNIPSHKMVVLKNVPTIESIRNPSKRSFRDELGVSHNSKLVGFIGRLEPVKGCLQFIKAASEILHRDQDFTFIIVGDGSERPTLERHVLELGIERYILFLGFCSDPANVFRSLDLYVLPSLDEGLPLALLEAMLLGVPVIATAVGGVQEVIQDGVNGILVPANNTPAMVRAIEYSLNDKVATSQRVFKAKKTIEQKYDVSTWVKKIEEIYLRLLL